MGLSILSSLITLSLYLLGPSLSLSPLPGIQEMKQIEKTDQIDAPVRREQEVVDVPVATARVITKKNDEMNIASAKQKVGDVPEAAAARRASQK
jgi:hypothetical protein